MNMSQVLHRRSHSSSAVRTPQSAPSSVPPSVRPPDERDGAPASWPMSAKVLVAILVVATVLGALGTAIASSSGNDSAERALQDRIDTLVQERDGALSDVAALDAELATVQQELLDAQAGNDGLTADITELEARIETLSAQRADALADAAALTVTVGDLEATIADLEGDLVELDGRADMLDAALKSANDRAAAAIAARDNLAKLFPINLDGSLRNANLVGKRDVKLTSVFSSGAALAPKVNSVTISRTASGNLRLDVPGLVEGGLFSADGALHLVASTNTAFPAVDGVARRADVTITLFPASFRVTDDGKQVVTGVSGVMTVAAPATGSTPAALAFYAIDVS